MSVKVKALDYSNTLRHAFLSGVVAARNIPAHEQIIGPALWAEYDPKPNESYERVLAALYAPQPITVQDAARVPEIVALIEKARKFHRACLSAWAAGEPPHKVKAMLDAADDLESALRAIAEGRA